MRDLKEIEFRFNIKFNNELDFERVRKLAKRIEKYIQGFSVVKTVNSFIHLQ